MVHLSRLSLTNFRVFRQTDIELTPGISVFHGANAQGKTALLEAAYTLAVGRAFRAEREREVVNFEAVRNGEAAYITGVAVDGGQDITVVVGYQPAAPSHPHGVHEDGGPPLPAVGKRIRVNRQPSTASGLVGRIGATLFVVDDLNLVLGSPSHRRRYLDVLISQAHREYLEALQRYQAALRNRNGLLRRQRQNYVDPDEMAYWDNQLVEAGVQIILRRTDAVRRLAGLSEIHHRELAETKAALAIEYRPNVPSENTRAETEAEFRRWLHQRAAREQATAITATGPHRDDIAIIINGLDANSYASRGEARTIALSLRLAEADYLSDARNDAPIILLDDVFSEMDASRRDRILRKTTAYRQALITTTDVNLVRATLGDDATYFQVNNGAVTQAD